MAQRRNKELTFDYYNYPRTTTKPEPNASARAALLELFGRSDRRMNQQNYMTYTAHPTSIGLLMRLGLKKKSSFRCIRPIPTAGSMTAMPSVKETP